MRITVTGHYREIEPADLEDFKVTHVITDELNYAEYLEEFMTRTGKSHRGNIFM